MGILALILYALFRVICENFEIILIVVSILLVLGLCCFGLRLIISHYKEKKAEEEREARLRQRREGLRLWWQTAQQSSPWYSMPVGAVLLIDSCVWMKIKDDANIRLWFEYVVARAVHLKWKLFVPFEVTAEIEKKKSGHDEAAAAAREAQKIMTAAQIELMEKGLFESHAKPWRVNDAYADPIFVPYLREHANAYLFTFDNHLAFVARQELKSLDRVCDVNNWQHPPYSRDHSKFWCDNTDNQLIMYRG